MTPILVTIILMVFLSFPLTGRAILKSRFHKEVRLLFDRAAPLKDKKFSYDQLEGLPVPVQNYFKHVLEQGQPYISYLRLQHGGWFKTGSDKKAMDIKGEQYFTASRPGFVWKGKTSLFTARDMYMGGKGRLVVSLFSLFKVADQQGPEVDQGELLRWLGESVWFPTNLLPRENLQWSPVDSNRAKLTFTYKGLSVYYIVTFNNNHEVVKLETQRHMEDQGLKPWVGQFSDYRNINGIRVPTVIEASWDLEEGLYTYGHFTVKRFEYDVPRRFP